MTDTQRAAQRLATDLARFRLAERAAEASMARIEKIMARVLVRHLQVR
jgi:hypothetical protein